jgi:hypothetical protein
MRKPPCSVKRKLKPRNEGPRFHIVVGVRDGLLFHCVVLALDLKGFNVVGASNVLPIFVGAWLVLAVDRESRSPLPGGSSVMYLGRVHKRFAPRLIHRARSRVLVSMALMRPYECRRGTSNVLCLSVAINVLWITMGLASPTYFPRSS